MPPWHARGGRGHTLGGGRKEGYPAAATFTPTRRVTGRRQACLGASVWWVPGVQRARPPSRRAAAPGWLVATLLPPCGLIPARNTSVIPKFSVTKHALHGCCIFLRWFIRLRGRKIYRDSHATSTHAHTSTSHCVSTDEFIHAPFTDLVSFKKRGYNVICCWKFHLDHWDIEPLVYGRRRPAEEERHQT